MQFSRMLRTVVESPSAPTTMMSAGLSLWTTDKRHKTDWIHNIVVCHLIWTLCIVCLFLFIVCNVGHKMSSFISLSVLIMNWWLSSHLMLAQYWMDQGSHRRSHFPSSRLKESKDRNWKSLGLIIPILTHTGTSYFFLSVYLNLWLVKCTCYYASSPPSCKHKHQILTVTGAGVAGGPTYM